MDDTGLTAIGRVIVQLAAEREQLIRENAALRAKLAATANQE